MSNSIVATTRLITILSTALADKSLKLVLLFTINSIMFKSIVFVVLCVAALAEAQEPKQAPAPAPGPAAQPVPVPVIIWGSCPQLEPSEEDKKVKSEVLAGCLKQFPIPAELTQENINAHQKNVAECALNKENWFEKDGTYKFSKAESEIKKKKLDSKMETELLKAHGTCREEAKQKLADKMKVVEQVQLYQSCMDFHITKVCQIQIQNKMVAQ